MSEADVEKQLFRWWEWSAVQTGRPDALNRRSDDMDTPIMPDEEALVVDAAVCALKRRWPGEHHAMEVYLRCGGNLAATARWMRCGVNTARLNVQNALAWLDATLSEKT